MAALDRRLRRPRRQPRDERVLARRRRRGAGASRSRRRRAGLIGAPQSPVTELRLRFFGGPRPADALRRFTAATGRQPPPAAPWLLGPWYQADGEAAAELEQLRAADAPVSALQTYTHYLPCGAQEGREDQERARAAAAHEAGVAITTYFNPMVCTSYSAPMGPRPPRARSR